MTKPRKGSGPSSSGREKAKPAKDSTRKPAAAKIRVSDAMSPLQVLFDDVLSRQAKREGIVERRQRQAAIIGGPTLEMTAPIRAALYVRVSNDRSVRSDLSMPDQEV